MPDELAAALREIALRHGFHAARRCLAILNSSLATELDSGGGGWEPDDGTEPPLLLTVSNRRGVVDVRIDPAWIQARLLAQARRSASDNDVVSARHRQRNRAPRGNRRTVRRRARAPTSRADDEPEPPPDVVRLAVASARLWAHVRRREAKQRLAIA